MRILITNDDGIHAPGLAVLERIAQTMSDDVLVVAPETDQSGAAHSLTVNDPLRLRRVADNRFAVRGTPTDCVILALKHIVSDAPPDLILAGVNRGSNIADDVAYSGTVAGAAEGTLLGVPAIALSQTYSFGEEKQVRWETAEAHAPGLVKALFERGISPNVLLNINFPDVAPDQVKGKQITRQGKRDQNLLSITRRKDGRGNPYYWIGFEYKRSSPPEGTDIRAIYDGYISVTPLSLDMTHVDSCDRFRDAVEG